MDMATARNIIRGTFRLSVAIAVLAAAYGFYEQLAAFAEYKDQKLKMLFTLECGARRSEETLKSAANQYGLIDLGKVGCASKQFLASSDELLQARNGVMRREMDEEFGVRPQYAPQYPLGLAVLALLIVNLLGFAFVALRAVFGWITSGYRPAP
jgi:hypothetical protein